MINLPDFDSSNFTILVVDDTEANRTIAATLLTNSGFKVMLAENGRLALQSIQEKQPDLVLLDVMMPEMDGFETCQHLKANEATHEIPVIFMTSLAATEDKLKGFNAGAVDYITRPLSQRELLARITTHLKNKVFTERFKQQALFMQTLNEIGQALTSTLDLRKVLTLILDEIRTLVAYDYGAILIRQDEVLEFAAARGYPSDTGLLHVVIPIQKNGDDLFCQVMQMKRPLAITNPLEHPGWPPISSLLSPSAWLGLPLIHQNHTIGILSLARNTSIPFTKNDIELATTFTSQAVLALQNARVYDQLSKFNSKLEKEVQIRTEDLQAAYSQLERLDNTKSDFIHVASHELFTPIALITGYCHILLSDPNLAVNESQAKIIEGINKGAKRLNEVVENLLDVAKIDNQDLHLFFQDMTLYPLLHQIRYSLDSALRERDISMLIHPAVQTLGTIQADPEALHKALLQLILNAIKFTPDGGKIVINGRSPQPNIIEISIQDNGIGIDPVNQELVFTKFYQTGEVNLHSTGKTKFKGGGPGLGLAIVKGIVETHGGKIWVESPGYNEETCPGSTFFIRLPRHQPASH
ncbi:MAG: response regulator [Anaerolineae bacterium]|nr:response regulator [Anaerolineae bacterium]